jgi:hypothetical protein
LPGELVDPLDMRWIVGVTKSGDVLARGKEVDFAVQVCAQVI